jgi:putative transposon-encoded protein
MDINAKGANMSGFRKRRTLFFRKLAQNAILPIGIPHGKMANKTERGVSKTEIETILNKKEVQQKILNSFNEFLRKQDNLKELGLVFEKTVTKFSKTSAAIYLPKRLIGRTFRVELTPIDEPYEISEPESDKLLKDTEKDLKRIQDDRKPLIENKPINPVL